MSSNLGSLCVSLAYLISRATRHVLLSLIGISVFNKQKTTTQRQLNLSIIVLSAISKLSNNNVQYTSIGC